MPFGHPARGWVLLGAAAVALGALAAARHRARSGEHSSSAALTRSLKLCAGGAVGALAAYAIFIPAEAKYVPLAPGLYNRVGLLAAPGAAIMVVGLAGATAELVCGARGQRRLTTAVAIALGLVVLAGWASRVHDDSLRWNDAAGWSRRVLASLESTAPRPGPQRVLYVTGYRRYGTRDPGLLILIRSPLCRHPDLAEQRRKRVPVDRESTLRTAGGGAEGSVAPVARALTLRPRSSDRR